jgi:hypothetical protein
LTSAKELIQSVQMCAMLQPTFYGLSPGPKTFQPWHRMAITLLVDLSLSLYMTARSIYVEQQVLPFKSTSGEWCAYLVCMIFVIDFGVPKNLFPHGIDVLRKTDFYAVSVRRNSFLVAAPQVAECVQANYLPCLSPQYSFRHPEYRSFLIDHLLTVTLRHWDVAMRQLGAQSLRAICQLDIQVLGPDCAQRAVSISFPLTLRNNEFISQGSTL